MSRLSYLYPSDETFGIDRLLDRADRAADFHAQSARPRVVGGRPSVDVPAMVDVGEAQQSARSPRVAKYDGHVA